MKKNLLVVVATISILVSSCSDKKNKMQIKIDSAEQKLKQENNAIPDKKKAADVIHLYLAFADEYPEDSLTAEYLFRAADITNGIKQPDQAIVLFERVHTFKNSSKAPIALFLQGFISETELHNLSKAKLYYEQFLREYPNHKLASDVQMTITNLGKSPEELIEEFEAKAQKENAVVNEVIK